MKVIRKIKMMQREMEKMRKKGKKIGFVPTMGYLHQGHIKLIREARKKSDIVVVSIFVNPTQFSRGEDYEIYPRDEKRDLKICRNEKVDYVFLPEVKEMYPDGYETFVQVEELQKPLCGMFRPGHFRGVATVVSKLFNIVKPHLAFFGLKDYQQALIIKKLVRDLSFDVKIEPIETVRDSDGLALSSRNEYLSEEERKLASFIPQALIMAKVMIDNGEQNPQKIKSECTKFLEEKGIKVQYFEIADPDNLQSQTTKIDKKNYLIALAVFVGKTRLIDNFFVKNGKIFNFPKKQKKEG